MSIWSSFTILLSYKKDTKASHFTFKKRFW